MEEVGERMRQKKLVRVGSQTCNFIVDLGLGKMKWSKSPDDSATIS